LKLWHCVLGLLCIVPVITFLDRLAIPLAEFPFAMGMVGNFVGGGLRERRLVQDTAMGDDESPSGEQRVS
jgi:hypothetical protein